MSNISDQVKECASHGIVLTETSMLQFQKDAKVIALNATTPFHTIHDSTEGRLVQAEKIYQWLIKF